MKYQITPIRNDFLMKVRESAIDDQNQPVVYITAEGGEPCRDVLRRAIAGEKLILASYCPFYKAGPYKEYGAVFVLANQSNEAVNYGSLPLPTNLQNNYFGDNFVLRAYDNDETIHDARLITSENADQTIADFFEHTKVKFIIARFAAYGCYALRIDRK
jgi:hypothetical protein